MQSQITSQLGNVFSTTTVIESKTDVTISQEDRELVSNIGYYCRTGNLLIPTIRWMRIKYDIPVQTAKQIVDLLFDEGRTGKRT